MTITSSNILVTGVAGYWGRSLAERLCLDERLTVSGIAAKEMTAPINDLNFRQLGLSGAELPALLRERQIDTVCHLDFIASDAHTEAMFLHNVMGTISLFGACAQAGVRKIVVRSSGQIYGALPENPAFLTEEHPFRGEKQVGTIRYWIENEQFWGKFSQTNPEVKLTILRFSNIVGGGGDSHMNRFLRQPRAPIPLGFDPMLQFIHDEDVLAALVYALEQEAIGAVNVAGRGAMPLSRALALARKFPIAIPMPMLEWGSKALGDKRREALPIPLDYLRYRWTMDTTKMGEWGFAPRYDGAEAVQAFVAGKHTNKWESLAKQSGAKATQLEQIIDQFKVKEQV